MNRKLFLSFVIALLIATASSAQTFSGTTGAITDNNSTYDVFTAPVTGLAASTSASFGVEYVTLNITHTWDGDLTVVLQSPTGTQITLTSGNGGSGNNYSTTVFRMDAATNVTAGSAPFNGSYIPQGNLGEFNNGEDPNGTWLLGVNDGASGDIGTVDSWSITFSSTPATPTLVPCAVTDCSNATVISSLPYTDAGNSTCGGCVAFDHTDACGSEFMRGNDVVYAYTPATDGWVDIVAQTAEASGGAERAAAVFLLDDCPSVPTANCIASSTVQYPANHGSPHIVSNLSSGITYYIVVSNGPLVYNADPCIDFDLVVTSISQPNPTEEDCFGAQPICGASITEATPGNGQGAYPSEINSSTSCLEGERNGKWYSFTAESTGTMTVLITPVTLTDDYDFALYNTTTGGCAGIFDGTSPEVSCNYEMVDGDGDTGIDSGNLENDFENTITVNAGETYMLYVSQWSVSTDGYTITLGGGADYIDSEGPELSSVDQPNCAQNEVVVHFSENIDCSSFASDGSDFTLTNPTGSSLTITGASSSICGAGGAFTEQVTLTLSGNITVAGTYTIGLIGGTISDQCGHATTGSSSVNFTIVTPTVTAGSNSSICAGQTLSLNETGGGANSWSWTGPNSFSSTSQNPNITSATTAASGTYTVTGTIAATACSSTDNVSVVVNALPAVNPTSNSPVCEGTNLTLGETGGDANAWVWTGSGSWNPSDVQNPNQASALVTSTGTYTVTVTDVNNCSNSSTVAVVVNPLPTVNPTSNSPVCEGTNLTLGETGGDATSWVWTGTGSWDPSDIQNPNQASALTSSTGTYTVVVSDGNCSNTANVSVIVNPSPTVSSGGNASICADETYTLGGSYGGGASSVLWTTSGDGSFDDATSPTAVYTPSGTDIPSVGGSANTITLTITTDDPSGPCSSVSDNMTLTINPMEDASFSYSGGTYCTTAADPSPTITGVGGGSFSAPAGLVINSSGVIDVSASTIGGPYTVTYTTPGTCSNSSTFDITITSGADAEFSYTSPICNSSANPLPSHTTGSNGTYSSTAGLVFVNAGTGEINLSASTPGTYTVTNFVDLGACGTATETFDITIEEAAEVFAGNNQTLCESNLSYGLLNATMGGSASSITWSGGTGSFANVNNINTNYVFGAGELGAVTLTVTTDDPVGVCPSVSDQIVLTIEDAAEVSAGSNAAICSGETYTLSGTQGGSTSNITWSTSGSGSFDDNTSLNAVYTPSSADRSSGSVILTISSNDPSGACGIVTSNMTLTINPLPTVNAGSNSPVCEGQTLNLTESGGNATSWVWTGSGSYDPSDVQNPSQGSIVTGATGTYTVTGTILSTGCSAQDVVNVTINPRPTVTAGSNSPICEGETLNLTETGGDADTWTWNSSTSYDPDDIQNPVHTNSIPSESGNYTVVGQISSTGCSASSVVSVTVNSLPNVSANADDNTVCEGTTVTLTGSGADTYMWSNSVTDGVAFTPSLGTTTYTVTGTNTTTNCSNTDAINVIVSPMPTVSAGSNDAICENETYILNGSYGGGASSATWSTSGNGTFDNVASLSAEYTPGSDDITAGIVTLTLTTNDPAGDCNAVSASMDLTINAMDDASFSYATGTYCNTATDPSPTITGLAGGTFTSSPAGLVIDSNTGVIDVSASTISATPYVITYTTNGTCVNTSTFNISITSGANAEFAYTTPVCSSGSNPIPTHTTGSNGVYSSTAGLVFVNAGTGEIDLSASTPGTYTVTNFVDLGACGSDTQTFDITIDQAEQVFAGNNVSVCESDGSYALLTASYSGTTNLVTWSGGSGTFDNTSDINTTYNFGAGEIGAITLTVTTGDPGTSCSSVSSDIILTIDQAPVVDAGLAMDSICAGEDYTLSGILSGSTSNITWSTSGDGTFDDEHILTATYTPGPNDITNQTVTLTITSNANGTCSAVSDDLVLRIDPLPNVVAGATTPLCVGQQLDLTETGGDADMWVWSGTGSYDPVDEQNPSLNSVYIAAAGTYTVQGTISATGCSSSHTVDVIVQPVPNVIAGVVNNPICSKENVELLETGGEADTWSWTSSNGYASTDNNPTIFNASSDTSGWYYVTGTISSTGCSAIDSVEITVNPLPNVAYTVSANDTVCLGESVVLTGTGNANIYTWNNSVNNGIAFVPLTTQTYTVLGEDANGCKDSVMVQVVVNPLPPVFAGNDQDVPYGGTTTINDASPTGLTYSWTPADSLVDASVLHPTTVPLHIFNQYILLGTDPVTGCQNKDTVDITVIGGPLSVQLFANPNDTVCNGDSHYIYAIPSGGVGDAENFTFVWDDGNGGIFPNNDTLYLDTVVTTRTYTLNLTDEGVGNVSASIDIVVNALPQISDIAKEDILCRGDNSGSITISATGDDPLSYSIDGGTTFSSTSLFENLGEASYNIVVQTANGCLSNGGLLSITQPTQVLTVSDTLNVDASCGNNNGMIALEVYGGTPPYSYQWDNMDTTYVSDSIAAGDYIVTVTDDNGCTENYPYTIINAGGGYIELLNRIDVDCFGDSTGAFTVKMTGGYPSFSFGTYFGGNLIDTIAPSNDSVYTVSNLPSNPYLIRALEGGSCNSTFEVSIGTNTEIMVTSTVTDLTCFEQTDGQIDLTITGGVPSVSVPNYTFNWSGPDSYTSALEDILLLDVGSYNVTVTDSLLCQVTLNNIVVNQPSSPDVTIGIENEEQCYGFSEGKITAVGVGGTPPYTYKWTNGSWSEYSQIIDSLVSGTYHLLLTDAHGCLIADSNVTISDYASIVINDSIYYYGARAGIELSVSGGTPAYDYEWEDSEGISLSSDSKVDNLINGTYYVTVSDFYGCSISSNYIVDIPFTVPTLISPNADGYNDTWKIAGIESYPEVHIEIYNRWGNMVFVFDGTGDEYGDVSNQFDGTYNGKELPIGSYVYVLDLKNGKEVVPGTLSIVRTK